ncbi:hypothetical protein PIB30_055860 [Stylosanthes scabra]|uniref:Uncharacterized protein n=1 Tax=Stylosanthes scabra TaxID=79078 RepID=A0ABU6SJ33_9FABA|nr:hypothetical protein [Stylosanthes scabra]
MEEASSPYDRSKMMMMRINKSLKPKKAMRKSQTSSNTTNSINHPPVLKARLKRAAKLEVLLNAPFLVGNDNPLTWYYLGSDTLVEVLRIKKFAASVQVKRRGITKLSNAITACDIHMKNQR